MKRLFFLLVIASFIITCKNTSNEPILLRINLQKGDKFNITTEVNSDDNEVPFFIETKSKMWVDAVNDEWLSCRVNVMGLKMRSKNEGENIEYSSYKKAENMSLNELELHEGFKNYINKDFTFKVSSTGNISHSVYDENGDYVHMEEIPVDIENFFPVFPDKSVRPADTWEGDKDALFGGNRLKITYTLKEISKREVVITFVSVAQNYDYSEKKSISKGEYILDREKWRLLKYKLETMSPLSLKDKTDKKIKITQIMEVNE